MTERLPCKTCGELIHPDTAAKNAGLCMPCKGGYRDQIEAGKKHREQERMLAKSPGRVYWRSLVNRVHGEPGGFEKLKPEEKTYYALRCLIGEVCNGGFHQLFANSSGDLYAYMLDGLLELEAMQSLQLLTNAKELLLGERPVPLDHATRDSLLPDIALFGSTLRGLSEALDSLEKVFYADPEQLDDRCTKYATDHALYSAE